MSRLPFGGSSNGVEAVSILLKDHAGAAGDAQLYESVEAAIDPKKSVGFRHNFSNITNFAQGLPAGESALHYANPFTFFVGDPFLERVKDNRNVVATDFDDGIGQKIFSETKSILDADIIDFDSDGQKDVIVGYKDGSLRLLRNHGGTSPFKDMGMLMVVAPGLRELWAGDVNGDGREDFVVRTRNQKLVAYINRE
jgi:hypothetical protein